ncbi:hypothetical protein RQP46_003792 [Phenoliferia psychrophenolica]
MDFLTQPLRSAVSPPSAAAVPIAATSDAPTASPPAGIDSDQDKPDTDGISFLSTTSDGGVSETGDRFAQLRTTEAGGREGESPLEAPSLRKGDWRAFSRIEARVVVWQDGELKRSGRHRSAEQETALAGTIWLTTDNQLVFVVDGSAPPRSEPISVGKSSRRSNAFESLSRRLSHSSHSRPGSPITSPNNNNNDKTLSPEPTISPGDASATKEKKDRRRSQLPFLRRKSDVEAPVVGGSGPEKDEESNEKGIFAFIKGLFGSHNGGDDNDADGGLSLSRTRTKTVEAPSAPRSDKSRSHSKSRSNSKSRKPEEPVVTRASPLPTYQNHKITALHIPTPRESITSIRFLPQRPTSPSSSASSPPLSRQISREASTNSASLNVNFGGIGALDLLPPRVEIEVVAKEAGASEEDGKGREVTVAFLFVEPLMAQEADELRQQLEERGIGVKAKN